MLFEEYIFLVICFKGYHPELVSPFISLLLITAEVHYGPEAAHSTSGVLI